MAKKLYVGGLAYASTEDTMRQFFAQAGTVTSASIVMDRETGRSKGFGFVEMPDDEAAAKAIKELHEATYDGKVISVNEARPREDRPKGNFGGGGNRGGGYSGGNRGGGRGGYNSDNKPKRW